MDQEHGRVEVKVEIPQGSRNKYEWDEQAGVMRLDRRLFSATVYPADYGYIPGTLAEDGDELDALVFLDEPTFPGCHVWARPVGVFWMSDEKGPDAKILSVLHGDPRVDHVRDLDDLDSFLRLEVEHFFEMYKDLEPGKSSSIEGFGGVADAWAEVEASRLRCAGQSGDVT